MIVGLLWVVAALNYLDRNMIATMRLSLKEAIPMTDAQGHTRQLAARLCVPQGAPGKVVARRPGRRWTRR